LSRRSLSLYAVFAGAFLVYFLWFTADGLNSWFSDDDILNIHYYWSRPWSTLVKANLVFFSGSPRPLGGLYDMGIFAIWGLHPLPYRVGALALVLANLLLLFLIVRELSDSIEAALLSLFLTGMNESFVSIYYDTGMIYDTLAFSFYFGMLLWYVRIRKRGEAIGIPRTIALLALYACALNGKEIAVSLPVALLIFEILWNPPSRFRFDGMLRWIAGPARIVWLTGLMTVAYLVGLVNGPDSVAHVGAYQPHPSWHLYLQTSADYLRQLTLNVVRPKPSGMAGILLGTLVVAAVFRRKHLIFASLMAMVAILPLAFIPVRGGFAFYIPSLFWSLWFAGSLVAVREALMHLCRANNVAEVCTKSALLVALAAYSVTLNARAFHYVLPIVHDVQNRNRVYNDELHRALPSVAPGTAILIENDPSSFPWMIPFLTQLSYNDHTLDVQPLPVVQASGGDVSKFPVRLDLSSGHIYAIK